MRHPKISVGGMSMKILHFLGIGRLPRRPMIDATGGTERVALEIAKIQVSRGSDVTIASMAEQSWKGTWRGVRLLHLSPFSLAGYRFGRHLRLASLIRLAQFDIVHLHEYLRTQFFASYPKVMHFHNNPLGDQDRNELTVKAPHYWSQVGKSSLQIAVSEFVRKRLCLVHQEAGLDARRKNIVTVQSGVDAVGFRLQTVDQNRRRVRNDLGLKDSDVLFLFAGAVRPEKGVDYLARAFARLCVENSVACLAIVGGSKLWIEAGWLGRDAVDSTEQQIRSILAPAIERNRAFLLGIISPVDIGAYYAAADVFVLPSMFQETFGLVILEAFSAGVPVIAFRSGGIPELVEDRKNGIIIDQGDEEALFSGMRELTSDKSLRERLGHEAMRTARRFSWESTVDQLDGLYRSVLNNKGIGR
jgi:glycosyltransferase involved in cell wall biosynthesis